MSRDHSITLKLSALTFNINGATTNFFAFWKKERKIANLLRRNRNKCKFDFFLGQEVQGFLAQKVIAYITGYSHIVSSHVSPFHCHLSLCRNGLVTMTEWKILEQGQEVWSNQTKSYLRAQKGFTWVKLQHKDYPNAKLTIYNVHGVARNMKKEGTEKKTMENFNQLADHISMNVDEDAVIVGGDFQWRHKWRPTNSRPTEGYIDPYYNKMFNPSTTRYDPFQVLMDKSGIQDVEYYLRRSYDHLGPVDKFFFKNGTNVFVNILDSPYLFRHTPWTGLSDHHPVALYFDITFN
jgi:hypothetical protein